MSEALSVLVWYPLVSLIAPMHGLPPELVMAVIYVESRGNPDAVSNAGAVGLMQIMPREAGEVFANRPPAYLLRSPATNIDVGCWILRANFNYYSKFAQTDADKLDALWRAVAAYYAGVGNVPRQGVIAHEGARRYIELVKGALKKLFPLYSLSIGAF